MPHSSESLALQGFPFPRGFLTLTFHIQSALDLARVAIALERHHLAEGRYPTALSELSPTYLPKIPHDHMNNEPLRYRIKPDGTTLLYSIGYNGGYDQGKVTKNNEEGDWVWQYTYEDQPPPRKGAFQAPHACQALEKRLFLSLDLKSTPAQRSPKRKP